MSIGGGCNLAAAGCVARSRGLPGRSRRVSRGRDAADAALDEKGPLMSGEADQAKGRIKQAVGDLTDDKDLKREGKVDEAAGKVKDAVDKVKDKLTGKD